MNNHFHQISGVFLLSSLTSNSALVYSWTWRGKKIRSQEKKIIKEKFLLTDWYANNSPCKSLAPDQSPCDIHRLCSIAPGVLRSSTEIPLKRHEAVQDKWRETPYLKHILSFKDRKQRQMEQLSLNITSSRTVLDWVQINHTNLLDLALRGRSKQIVERQQVHKKGGKRKHITVGLFQTKICINKSINFYVHLSTETNQWDNIY